MYINSYIIPVAEDRKDDYVRLAKLFVDIASEHGAIEVFENWELDVPDGELTDYRKAVDARAGERIVVAWVIWPDRDTGARAHKAMFEDPRMTSFGNVPFDGKRMILGGFEPLVSYRKP